MVTLLFLGIILGVFIPLLMTIVTAISNLQKQDDLIERDIIIKDSIMHSIHWLLFPILLLLWGSITDFKSFFTVLAISIIHYLITRGVSKKNCNMKRIIIYDIIILLLSLLIFIVDGIGSMY